MNLYNYSTPLLNNYMPTSINFSYLTEPKYQNIRYSFPTQIIYIIFGILSALGNLYLIVLFASFRCLRSKQCNWLIFFLCTSNVLIGFGTFMRAVTFLYAVDKTIVIFDMTFCCPFFGPFHCGFRVGQIIALLIAFDRLLVIWKPIVYAKREGNKSPNALIITSVFLTILFVYIYGFNEDKIHLQTDSVALYLCLYSTGKLYEMLIPFYSTFVTIGFFLTYTTSLVLFSMHITIAKKELAHAQPQMSTVQKKLFITVSMTLFCYTVFYAFPSTLQLLTRYFKLSGSVFDSASYIINYGASLNGCFNAMILLKHHEFKACSSRLIPSLLGRSFNNTVNAVAVRNGVEFSNNIT